MTAVQNIGDAVQCIVGAICCCCVSGSVLISARLSDAALLQMQRTSSDGHLPLGTGWHAVRHHASMSAAFLFQADEFKVAVRTWNNGKANKWDHYRIDAWTCDIANTCGGRGSGKLIKDAAGETSRDPHALGAEPGESDFTSYTALVYDDLRPATVGTASSTATACDRNVVISLNGNGVRSLICVWLHCCFMHCTCVHVHMHCTCTSTGSSSVRHSQTLPVIMLGCGALWQWAITYEHQGR
jgi:hypothetical protein